VPETQAFNFCGTDRASKLLGQIELCNQGSLYLENTEVSCYSDSLKDTLKLRISRISILGISFELRARQAPDRALRLHALHD
jgi:hypothetical protein